MGLSSFVSHFLANARPASRASRDSSTPSAHQHSSTPSRSTKNPTNPPRRRRTAFKDDFEPDWESAWAFGDDLQPSDYYDSPNNRRRRPLNRRRRPIIDQPSSTSSPSRRALKLRRDPVNPDTDWSKRSNPPLKHHFDDREAPPSRRRNAWMKRSIPGPRIKSNLEASMYKSNHPSISHSSPSHSPPHSRRSVDPFQSSVYDSSPSLRRFLGSHRHKERYEDARHSYSPYREPSFQDDPRLAPPQPRSLRDHRSLRQPISLRDPAPKRRGGRIMSNIDQLLRRDPSDEKRPNSERRRHSALYDQIIDPRNPNPLSIINEAALDLENADTERVRAHIPGVERVSPPEAAPSVQSTAKSKALRQKLQLTLQTDMSDPLSMARRFVDAEGAGPPQIRFSADASFPVRPREPVSPNFPRSQSNPAHRTQPSNPNAKSMQKKRPPPLLTPLGGASGFAFGVGADSSGIRRISIGRENIPAVEEKERNSSAFASTSSAPKDSAITQITPMEASAKTKPFSLGDVDDGISEPKAYSKSDIWNSETDRSGDVSSGPRFSKRPSEKERDLFYFEEASQSSFGDTDSPSRIAAKNGIVPIERKKKFGEVMEDNFVFGPDESFSDGGFIISSNGLVEPPEKVSRKMSDGIAVEGVPTSSNNLIIVRSLAEFQKRFTFKDKKSEHGSSTLGRGAAGKVYLAVHEPTRRKLAVKEINIYDQDKRNQLRKELVTLISLRSRFLVRSFGACYDGNGGVHVALEYMDRGSLSDIVAQQGRIPEVVTCKIAEHCIRGLVFLHKNHILHRDVKTGNILLSRKLCRAKLSDFGLARDLKEGKSSGEGKDDGEGSSVTRTFVGTIAYMSPERLNGEEYTYASDVWGLGIAVMECIMGRYPFEKPQSYFDVIDAAQSAPATLIEGEVSEELVDFIRVSTHVDPNQRPKVSELLEHPWIKSKQDNANALKDWLDALPKLHCENVEVGAELAFNSRAEKEAKTKAKIRAKAEESRL